MTDSVGKKDQLLSVVERMFQRCFAARQYKQAVGIALETRRLDILERAITESDDVPAMLSYSFGVTMNLITNRAFRDIVLQILSRLFAGLPSKDYFGMCQCFVFLCDAEGAAVILAELLADGNLPLAYQIAFDLYENATQLLIGNIKSKLASSSAVSIETAGYEKVCSILVGDITVALYVEFLSRNNHADILILKGTKDVLNRNSVHHSATVMSNSIMYAGTTADVFLRENEEWLRRATHWAKFSAVASLGVIHKGHSAEARLILDPYLPKESGNGGGPYETSGGLYALGLVNANHGASLQEYFLGQLRTSAFTPEATEILQHGACLGAGLAGMATANAETFGQLNNILMGDSAVAGEAAGIAMGLVMLGTANLEAVKQMTDYARETQHEKAIRGLALGVGLIMYGWQEKADATIETLLTDKDHLIRMGGVHTAATAYAGTGANTILKRLLHIAVSDVSDDVRRCAVTTLGFVLCRTPDQIPSTVMLLCESFNPHVRYGSAMALGIGCAGTGNAEAISLIEALLQDSVGYVRQGAMIAFALIMTQQPNSHPKSKSSRAAFTKVIGNQHEDILSKFGAIFAQGIIEAGGRNVTTRLVNQDGHVRMEAVVGMLVFTQFWFWFPLGHFLSLAMTPTTVICLNENLKMPKISIRSNAPPSAFAPPPMTEVKKEEKKEKVATVTLSITSKTKARGGAEADAGKSADKKPEDSMAVDAADTTESVDKENIVTEPDFCDLSNPSRVLVPQLEKISLEDCRYAPIRPGRLHAGVSILIDTSPDKPEELVEMKIPPSTAAGTAEDDDDDGVVAPPEPFEFDEEIEEK